NRALLRRDGQGALRRGDPDVAQQALTEVFEQVHGSPSVGREVAAEQFVRGRHPGWYDPGQSGDVEEVPVGQVVRDAVAGPRARAPGQGEPQAVVETAAGPETVRLVDQHPAHPQPFRDVTGPAL